MEYSLPEQFEQFGEARRAGFLRVKELKEQGGRVAGTFCTFTPLEILDAAGFTPVSLCGMSQETIAAAEAHLPANLCPLIKSSYGFAVSDKCPYTYFSDLIVGETTCDGKKKMYELLGELKPVYVLHLPQGHEDYAIKMWTEELHRFIAFLEQKFGVAITDKALRTAARQRNAERHSRMELMAAQKLSPPPAFGQQLYQALDGAGFVFDPAQRIQQMDGLRQDLLSAYRGGERPVPSDAKRIMVTGCPIGGVLNKIVGGIENAGGVVVCFENCTGIKASRQMVDTEAPDIVQAIAERYLDIGCAVMTPDNGRMELLRQLTEEYAIDGIIEVDLQTCTPYAIEARQVGRLAQELGKPYLRLETDYSAGDGGQISTRLDAFFETL
mgnify:FL=1